MKVDIEHPDRDEFIRDLHYGDLFMWAGFLCLRLEEGASSAHCWNFSSNSRVTIAAVTKVHKLPSGTVVRLTL